MGIRSNSALVIASLVLWSLPVAHAQAEWISQPIENRYIVRFKDSVGRPDVEAYNLVRAARGELHFTYTSAIKGFAATLPPAAVTALRSNPNVLSIEQDATVSVGATQSPATWGLDRIDQRALPLNNSYVFNPNLQAVFAFVIDTGILANHAELSGRVRIGDGLDVITAGGTANDCNGHGTHVAGTIGGTTYGVAKNVWLIPVRVLNCTGSGTTSGVIEGVDHVAKSGLRPAVANMSLGGGASSALDAAVEGAVSKGVTMVVAAGNSNRDACNFSPARAPNAITVGATTNTDQRASYSNFGRCLDLFAPGSSITSAWYTSSTAINTISGTSMASPHVAGVAALIIGSGTTSPASVVAAIKNNATRNVVSSAGRNSPNLLLYSSPPTQ